MDHTPDEPGTPLSGSSSGALQPVSSDRFNQQRDTRRGEDGQRDSITVSDKISQFNSLAVQSKQLERKTADAALKRAMLGREEAEAEMRRYRDEARALRKQVEEGKERERRVGERLETVMVSLAHKWQIQRLVVKMLCLDIPC
jgi:seryl-tRNA synthetase